MLRSLGRVDLGLAMAGDDTGGSVCGNLNADRRESYWPNRDQRPLNFGLHTGIAQNPPSHQAARQLDLRTGTVHARDVGIRVTGKTGKMRRVELQFHGRVVTYSQRIASHDRGVDGRRNRVGRVTAPDRRLPAEHAQAGHGTTGLIRGSIRRSGRVRGRNCRSGLGHGALTEGRRGQHQQKGRENGEFRDPHKFHFLHRLLQSARQIPTN